MTDQKLYRVDVEFTYYCQAESADAAADFARDAALDIALSEYAHVEAVRPTDKLDDGWTADSCVYHVDFDDLKLSDVPRS